LSVVAERTRRQIDDELASTSQRPTGFVDNSFEMMHFEVLFALSGGVPKHRQFGRANCSAQIAVESDEARHLFAGLVFAGRAIEFQMFGFGDHTGIASARTVATLGNFPATLSG